MYGTLTKTKSIYAVVEYQENGITRYVYFSESFNMANEHARERRKKIGTWASLKKTFDFNVVEVSLHLEK